MLLAALSLPSLLAAALRSGASPSSGLVVVVAAVVEDGRGAGVDERVIVVEVMCVAECVDDFLVLERRTVVVVSPVGRVVVDFSLVDVVSSSELVLLLLLVVVVVVVALSGQIQVGQAVMVLAV